MHIPVSHVITISGREAGAQPDSVLTFAVLPGEWEIVKTLNPKRELGRASMRIAISRGPTITQRDSGIGVQGLGFRASRTKGNHNWHMTPAMSRLFLPWPPGKYSSLEYSLLFRKKSPRFGYTCLKKNIILSGSTTKRSQCPNYPSIRSM